MAEQDYNMVRTAVVNGLHVDELLIPPTNAQHPVISQLTFFC